MRLEGWLQLLPMLRDARLRALLSMRSVGAATAELVRAYFSALFNWPTRLVCSQEKPPSFSGARPKWP